jgi:glutaredoxin
MLKSFSKRTTSIHRPKLSKSTFVVCVRHSDLRNPISHFYVKDDGDLIQAILFRLTKRKTVPNVILRGQSIGGFDELRGLDGERKLVHILEDAKIEVNGNASSM